MTATVPVTKPNYEQPVSYVSRRVEVQAVEFTGNERQAAELGLTLKCPSTNPVYRVWANNDGKQVPVGCILVLEGEKRTPYSKAQFAELFEKSAVAPVVKPTITPAPVRPVAESPAK